MYLAATLRQAGISCAITDCYALNFGVAETVAAVAEYAPKIVGLSILIRSSVHRVRTDQKALQARFPRLKIVLGNLHADIFAEWFLSLGLADAVAHGEGEQTFTELYRLSCDGDPGSVSAGISYRAADGAIRKTPPRRFCKTSIRFRFRRGISCRIISIAFHQDAQDRYRSCAQSRAWSAFIACKLTGCRYVTTFNA